MQIDFRQGIITYPVSLNQQVFLSKTNDYVSLQTINGRIDITFAHGTEDYLFTETADTVNAWGPFVSDTDYWLYWDINTLTAVRTFGFTTIEPIISPTEPLTVIGLHWFNTTDNKMYVYQVGGWRAVIRVFAAKINNSVFTGLGSGITGKPFAGTQVGLTVPGTTAGRILVDNVGSPIRRSNGLFFTTESEFFINGSPVNAIRLESSVFNGTAVENIARYQVVKFSQFGRVELASYNDIDATVIAMCMENLLINQTGTLVSQGVVSNPDWTFANVGASLWVGTSGELTDTDPHLTDPITHPNAKPPIGRVLTQTSIIFDQSIGGMTEAIGGSSGPITLSGDVVGTGTSSITTALADVASPGQYTKVSIDSKGRVVLGTVLSSSDIPNLAWSKITSGVPTSLAGYGITDGVVNLNGGTPGIHQSIIGLRPDGAIGQLFIDTTNNKIQRYDGAAWVDIAIGSAAPISAPDFSGIVGTEEILVNNITDISSVALTTTTMTPTEFDSFVASAYTSAEYLIQIKRGSNTQITKILLTHNGTTVYLGEYGTVTSGTELGSFDASIESGSVQIVFTATSTASTVVKAFRTLINA
ncbi:MAG: hypothetical protein ACXW2E_00180 [Nitrososphaeraceae archaeon]